MLFLRDKGGFDHTALVAPDQAFLDLMEGFEAQGPHYTAAHRLAAALVPFEHPPLPDRIIDVAPGPNPHGGVAFERDRLMTIQSGLRFLFVDKDGIGEYRLIGTSEEYVDDE